MLSLIEIQKVNNFVEKIKNNLCVFPESMNCTDPNIN